MGLTCKPDIRKTPAVRKGRWRFAWGAHVHSVPMRPKSSLPPKKKPAAPSARGQAAHDIRIIGGQWRRTPIKVLDKPGLRPTPDRVRETLFNWLGQDLTGWHCVDAFAGTGALGLEAASRGATVQLVEQPSPLLLLASSQASAPAWTTPSPQNWRTQARLQGPSSALLSPRSQSSPGSRTRWPA